MKIIPSARKHGVSDADILHALANYLVVHELDDQVVILIGPRYDGQLLEIGVVTDSGEDRVIHAMAARPRFLRGER